MQQSDLNISLRSLYTSNITFILSNVLASLHDFESDQIALLSTTNVT